jgi:anaerobic magnesium-protoporphyrin IX monomethyl ester cyclase
MKIGLLHITLESPLCKAQKGSIHVAPLGLGYIASYLQAMGGHSDLFSLKLYDDDNEKIVEDNCLAQYDLLGFTVHTQNFRRTMSLVDYLKKRRPDMNIVLGGAHASVCHQDIIRDFENVDVVVRGDGELVFPEVIECLSQRGNLEKIGGITFSRSSEIIETPRQELSSSLDFLPYPRRDFAGFSRLTMDRYDYRKRRIVQATVLNTSRGCPYKCSFCAIHENMSRPWAAHSSSYVLNEASRLRDELGVEHFFLLDANFLVDPSRALMIARGLSRLGCTWSCATRVDQLLAEQEMVRSFRDLGCAMIELGIESGSQSVLHKYNKGTTVSQNEEAIAFLREIDIKLGFDFIMFMPDMTFDELSESFAFLKRNGLAGIEPFETLMKCANLYPGTALRREWEVRQGIIASPHELPRYDFEDKGVQKVYSLAIEFINHYGIDVKQRIIAVRKASFHLEGAMARRHEGFTSSMKKELQRIVLDCDLLNRIPFNYFERLLAAVGDSREGDANSFFDRKWNDFIGHFCSTSDRMIERLQEMEACLKLADGISREEQNMVQR